MIDDRCVISLLLLAGSFGAFSAPGAGQVSAGLPFEAMAARIVRALQPERMERAILRIDASTPAALTSATRAALERAGVGVEVLTYERIPDFSSRMDRTDIYIWLPVAPASQPSTEERAALNRWLDSGRGRQIHFHWGAGTSGEDGLPGQHSPAYDRIYADALEIDYAALDRRMNAVMARLRSSEVRVTTPAGTDLRFRVGDRPFTKQNGDASRQAMASARVRIDREIELPAGALRVAPLETSVQGRIVIPRLRVGGTVAEKVELTIRDGRVSALAAVSGEAAVRRLIDSAPGLSWFREFALGFNPRLVAPAGERWIPYYGYGAGIVRLSLGDNTELGGAVKGGGVQWFFFADATVTAGGAQVVESGKLSSQ